MTSSVPDETRDPRAELLAQLRNLVPSAVLYGEFDRDALLGALGLDDASKPAFSFSWPGIERAHRDARVPVGEYSPDRAIVYDENGTQRLYLVRETKDTHNLDDLDWDEAMRIRFVEHYFDAAPIGPVNSNYKTDKHRLLIGGVRGDD